MAVTSSNSTDYSKVAFSNSTAAANLTNSALTEDNLGVITFDVLAASGGGAKTTIWSVDDGDRDVAPPTGTTLSNNFANYNTDLLYKDATGAVNAEYTALGGKFWIDGGVIKYDASGISPDVINAVAVGDYITDTFQYTIRMSNGTLSVGTLAVKIMNAEDGPTVISHTDGSVTEDAANPTLTDTGTIKFDDADLLDTHTVSDGVADSGNTLGGTLTASITDVATGAGDGTVTWNYSVANSATQYLAAGETAHEKFTVTISDGHTGGTVDQVIDVVVHGVNDDSIISGTGAGHTTGSVTEDVSPVTDDPNTLTVETGNYLTTSGTLAFTDADWSDTHSVSVSGVGSTHGTLTAVLSSDTTLGTGGGITWVYSVDNSQIQGLNATDHPTDTFTIDLYDGHTHVYQNVVITINGADEIITPPPGNDPKTAPDPYTGGGDPYDTVPSNLTLSAGATQQADVLAGTSGNDNGGDALNGLAGGDLMFGLAGNDIINGNNGNDKLFGGSGADSINGNNGNDIIVGGYGADHLQGNSDNDTFVYLDFKDTGDDITGFTSGQDKIAFASNLGVTWNEISLVQSGANTLVNVDVPGGSTTQYEMQIVLVDVQVAGVHQSDFQFNYNLSI